MDWKSEQGATAIEYSLIAGFIALVIVAAAIAVGVSLQNPFNILSGALP